MNFNLSWQVIFLGSCAILAIIGTLILRWHRTRSNEEELTTRFRDGNKATVAVVVFLGVSFLPFASTLYIVAGIVLFLYVVYYVARFIWEEIQEAQEVTRPLTAVEQRIADDTLLYARTHKKLPPPPDKRPARQTMRKVDVNNVDRHAYPYNRLDWALIDRSNSNIPTNP